MVPDDGERKLTLASAETLFSPAQKSIEEFEGCHEHGAVQEA